MFKIRVQTIDGDVDYYDLDQGLVGDDPRGHLMIYIRTIRDRFYPEYRVKDLQCDFVFVEVI